MSSLEKKEVFLSVNDSKDNIYMSIYPSSTSNKWMLITHGIAEHSDCHESLAQKLQAEGISVLCWDLPGHGRSYGKRGYIKSFEEFFNALDQVLLYLQKLKPEQVYLFGHSLGGLIAFNYILNRPSHLFNSLILSSPAFAPKLKIPLAKDLAARILHKLSPKTTIPHQIEYLDLSRDLLLIEKYHKDPLRHKKFSSPLYLGILNAMERAHDQAYKLEIPILMQTAGDDKVVDTQSSQKLFQKIGSKIKTYKCYGSSKHEVYNDLDKKEVIDDLLEFLAI